MLLLVVTGCHPSVQKGRKDYTNTRLLPLVRPNKRATPELMWCRTLTFMSSAEPLVQNSATSPSLATGFVVPELLNVQVSGHVIIVVSHA